MDPSQEDQQQFEQVLSRLDALMKRGHAAQDVPSAMVPPPAGMQSPPQSESSGAEADEEESLSAQDAIDTGEVPVLTEVYEPPADAIPLLQDALEDDADIEQAILDRWLPALHQAMDGIVEEETRRFREGLQERLHQQVADALRQHIRALKGQTEM